MKLNLGLKLSERIEFPLRKRILIVSSKSSKSHSILRNEFRNSVVVHSASAVPPLSPRSRHRKYNPRVLFNALNTSLRTEEKNENGKKTTTKMFYFNFGPTRSDIFRQKMKNLLNIRRRHTHTTRRKKKKKKVLEMNHVRRRSITHDTATAAALYTNTHACRLTFTYSFTTKNGSSKDMTKSNGKYKYALKLNLSNGDAVGIARSLANSYKNPFLPNDFINFRLWVG